MRPWPAAALALIGMLAFNATAHAEKSGGTLRIYNPDSPPGLNIYEQATPFGQAPLMAVYNNLILFDQHDPQVRLETIRPDLATKWEWNEDGTALTFTLRQGIKWHDGQPFTAKDVLCTVDLQLDKAKDKVRFNPRKSNFKNLETVTADTDGQVTFHLKRRQPAFPILLANGFSAITPCHQTPDQMRPASDRHRSVQVRRVQAEREHSADAKPGLLETGFAFSRRHRVHDRARSGDRGIGVYRRQVRHRRRAVAADGQGHHEPAAGLRPISELTVIARVFVAGCERRSGCQGVPYRSACE